MRPDGRTERGGVAIFMAAVFVLVVGMAAYVVDVGGLFEERRDLQNGADAAALAVAMECALNGGASPCPNDGAVADQYADPNSNDGDTNIASVTYPTANSVKVEVFTADAGPNRDGDAATVDHWFARIWGNNGSTVVAEAIASWEAIGAAEAIPIIMSSCEWDIATQGGTVWDVYTIIYLHDDNANSGGGNPQTPPQCKNGPGQDVDGDGDRNEGGFGYLESSDCSAYITAGGYVQGEPGAGNPGSLGCTLSDIKGKTLLIPIFDDIPDNGNPCGAPAGQPCYHVYGFGAFKVLDVDLTGGQWNNNGNICNANQRCLGGMFTGFVTLEDYQSGGGNPPPDLGVYGVKLIG